MEQKRSKDVFDYTTEELDLEDTRRIKSLSKKEYAIFKWGRGENRCKLGLWFTIGLIIGVTIGYWLI